MTKRQGKIGDFMALLVFALFTVCLLLVLLGGAGVYRNIAETGDNQYEAFTAGRYLATRVRQGHDLCLENFGGVDALTFREEIEGEGYITRVYCYEGYLYELFTPEDGEFAPEDGERILELERLDMTLEQDVLRVHTGGQALVLTLREGRQVAP